MILGEVEEELKSRFASWGTFNQEASKQRLRYAQNSALRKIWRFRDWDFKKSSSTLVTTSGNLGPYDAPSGLVRFCQVRRLSSFGYIDKYTLAPIISDNYRIEPYINVSDGKIYFITPPSDSNLTINYVGSLTNLIDDTSLTNNYSLFPDYLIDPVLEFTLGELKRYLPGMEKAVQLHEQEGRRFMVDIWDEITRDIYQKVIAPKGLNQLPVDFVAKQITVLGDTMGIQTEYV